MTHTHIYTHTHTHTHACPESPREKIPHPDTYGDNTGRGLILMTCLAV